MHIKPRHCNERLPSEEIPLTSKFEPVPWPIVSLFWAAKQGIPILIWEWNGCGVGLR